MTILERILCRFGFHGKREQTAIPYEIDTDFIWKKGAYSRCTTCGRLLTN